MNVNLSISANSYTLLKFFTVLYGSNLSMTNQKENKNRGIKFEDFVIENMTTELRYDARFAFWDKAGALFDTFGTLFPDGDLSFQTNNQNSLTLTLYDRYEILIEINRLIIASKYIGSKFKEYVKIADLVYRSTTEYLDIPSFSRIGLRRNCVKTFEKAEEASAALKACKSVKAIIETVKPQEREKIEASVSLRINTEAEGSLISLATGRRAISLDLPFPFSQSGNSEVKELEQFVFVIDIDSYTRKITAAEQLELKTWIEGNHLSTPELVSRII